MKNRTRALSLLIAIALLVTMLPTLTLHVRAETISGNCGAQGGNVTWTLDTSTGALTISGSGNMYPYEGYYDIPWRSNMLDIKTVDIQAGVTSISPFAFYDGKNITTISVPNTVTAIGQNAFCSCVKLTSITIPNGVTRIETGTFAGCEKISSFVLPPYLTYIGFGAFGSCKALLSINIPNTVYEIDQGAFGDCTGLFSVTLSSNITLIPYGCFEHCISLKSIDIPNGVTTIGERAFNQCENLLTVTVPQSVTMIEAYAFNGCSKATITFYTSYCNAYDAATTLGVPGSTILRGYGYLALLPYMSYRYGFTYEIIPCEEDRHEFITTDYQPPTCTENGFVKKTCNICGEEREEVLSAAGHQYVAIAHEDATCTSGGYTTYHCSVCNDEYTETIDALGHDWSDWAPLQAPTCTAPGSETRSCARCGEKENRAVSALGHDYQDTVISPSCTEQGYTIHTCSRCEDSFRDTYMDPLGHDWDDGVVTVEATYTSIGVMTYTCNRCGTTKTEEIPPLEMVNPFVDVKEGKFYYVPVLWAYYHDPQITKGVDDTHFKPNSTCTRGQVVTFLWNAMGQSEPDLSFNPFEDVKEGKFYYKAVLWAYQTDVTNGVDDTHFKPNNTCTRGQVVTFLWNAMGKPEPDLNNNPFVDVKEGKFYYKAVLWAFQNGVTNGVDDTHFKPNNTCTRGQVVTFLDNALAE